MKTIAPTFEEKCDINARFMELYEKGESAGTHGFYETMFVAMHGAYEEYLSAKLSLNPSPTPGRME